MRAKSAKDLEAKWKDRSWYRESASPPGELPKSKANMNLRLARAVSWLRRAEKEYEACDFDAAFIFYWIAFNAMYGQLVKGSTRRRDDEERRQRLAYLESVLQFPVSQRVIYDTVFWSERWDDIKNMLENKYVYYFYWQHYNNSSIHGNWEKKLNMAHDAIENPRPGQTKYVLCELFDRLNVLRNQLLHGGAKWKSRVNNQHNVQPSARIMRSLVPHFIDVMIEHPDHDWGTPHYRVVPEKGPHSGYAGG